MGPFLTLFHFDGHGSNRRYEDFLQWFVVDDVKGSLSVIDKDKLVKLIEGKSNHGNLIALAGLLGASLQRTAYDLFIEEIRPLEHFFYSEGAVDTNGFTDFEGTKDLNYAKYRLFKFAAFLDLLSPSSVSWRGQADLKGLDYGLEQFTAVDLQGRASLLSRWIQNPAPIAFSEGRAKRADAILKRRAFLLKLDGLSAGEIARRLDTANFKPLKKFSSYKTWYLSKPKSFGSWLSRERAESRRVWNRKKSTRS